MNAPATPPTVPTALLLRHGESDYNAAGRMQGASDRPRLTARGEAQARAAAALLPSQVDALFVSPLARAARTAELLRAVRPDLPQPQVLDELREIDLPEWEGRAFAEIDRDDAERRTLWRSTPERLVMQNEDGGWMRPCDDVFRRAAAAIARLQALSSGRTALVVAHSGVIRAVMALLFGVPQSRLHVLAQDNATMHRVALHAGSARLLGFGESIEEPATQLGRALGGSGPLVVLTPWAVAPAVAAVAGMRLGRQDEVPGPADRVVIPGDAAARTAALARFAAIPPAAAAALTARKASGSGLHAFVPAGPHGPAVITVLDAPAELVIELVEEL